MFFSLSIFFACKWWNCIFQKDNRCTVSVTLEETDFCRKQNYDPEDPRCARVMLSGRMVRVNVFTNFSYWIFKDKSFFLLINIFWRFETIRQSMNLRETLYFRDILPSYIYLWVRICFFLRGYNTLTLGKIGIKIKWIFDAAIQNIK